MSSPIDVTVVTIVPPSAGSTSSTATCIPITGYVKSDCEINADMWWRFFDTRKITIKLQGYSFATNELCVGPPTCSDLNPSTWTVTSGIASNVAVITAKQHFDDLKYTLYIKDPHNSSATIIIDPMIRNGIRPVMNISVLIAAFLGLIVLGVLGYVGMLGYRRFKRP